MHNNAGGVNIFINVANNDLLAAFKKAAEMQIEWLICLRELKTFLGIINQAIGEKQVRAVITKTDGNQLEILSLGPILLDTMKASDNTGLIIESDSPADDIYKKVKPLLEKIKNGTGGLTIRVSDGPGSHIGIPLIEIEKIEITKIEEA